MPVPTHLRYSREHEWLDLQGETATVGITAFAADALGDVVYVELPEVGSRTTAGEPCGEIESTKSVTDLHAPADGEVVEVNQAVVDDPGVLNSDPFGNGWLLRIALSEAPELMDAAAYDELTSG